MKIVVVDDEYFMRMGIKTIATQKEKGHIVIGEAENGDMAVERIMDLDPDMVFLDITMPGKDGIEVLKTVREKGYDGYIAMLTCHEDFQFAQQALRNGADDYVLKNELVGDAMTAYLEKVSGKIEDSCKRAEGREEANELEGHRFYRENFLKNMIKLGGITREDFIRGCQRYGIKVRPEGIYLILIRMERWEEVAKRYRDSDFSVLFSTIDNMMAEIFRDYPESVGFYTEPYLYHIMLTCCKEASILKREQNIREIMSNIRYHFEEVLDIEIKMAVYRNTYPVEEMDKAYEEALALLGQSWFFPGRSLNWQGGQSRSRTADVRKLEERLKAAEKSTRGIAEAVRGYLEETKDMLQPKEEFCACVERSIRRLEEKYGGVFQGDIRNAENVEQMEKELERFEAVLEKAEETNGYSFLIKRAVQIVEGRFSTKITLEQIAEELGISAGYFSRVFSEEVGETFSNYLIRRRVEYAKKLIMETNFKFYEIAEMTGFNSAVHFNNMFKKVCGVTPNQYRKDGDR